MAYLITYKEKIKLNKMPLILLSMMLCFALVASTAIATPSSNKGTGVLNVFIAVDDDVFDDQDFAVPSPIDDNAGGSFVVFTGELIGIEISGISEFSSSSNNIQVWIKGPDFTVKIPITIDNWSEDNIRVLWLVGDTNLDGIVDKDIPFCTTMPISYGTPGGGQLLTDTPLNANIGHLHAVPEYLYGGIAAIGACFAGFAAFKSRKGIQAKIKP